ncbi:MAG TPA: helix-turn-helix transcriptional regulator [Acidimicrobiales bacterium]|jgi:HTH-type transcriptional regulator/antitoxin MqsA|nr:helix-turn-helix transcriptional regulator [Acidimicrobiales bacterium]
MSPNPADFDPKAVVRMIEQSQLPPSSIRRNIRLAAHLSLREMANALGVSPMTLLRWESGDATPRRAAAVRYRTMLDSLAKVTL